jgi:hypothetical protein
VLKKYCGAAVPPFKEMTTAERQNRSTAAPF